MSAVRGRRQQATIIGEHARTRRDAHASEAGADEALVRVLRVDGFDVPVSDRQVADATHNADSDTWMQLLLQRSPVEHDAVNNNVALLERPSAVSIVPDVDVEVLDVHPFHPRAQ